MVKEFFACVITDYFFFELTTMRKRSIIQIRNKGRAIIMKTMKKRLLSAVLCAAMAATCLCAGALPARASAAPLKFAVMADPHYGYNAADDLIVDGAFEQLRGADFAGHDILLIAGDLTDRGAKTEHDRFLAKLREAEAAGMRVYVVTADHDFEGGSSGYTGPCYKRSELSALYADFGFGEALSRFEDLSYTAQLAPGYRLLVLNLDGSRGFAPGQLAWALAQVREAVGLGEQIIGMWHYPVLDSLPVFAFEEAGMASAAEEMAQLADAGLRFGFSGHIHAQLIDYIETAKKNRFYEIITASMMKSPSSPLRKVTLSGTQMEVKTLYTTTVPAQELSGRFDAMARGLLEAMAEDVGLLSQRIYAAVGYKADLAKYEKLVLFAGRLLNKLDFKTLGWIFLCPWKVDKSVRDLKLKDFLIQAVNNLFTGNRRYTRETPEGRLFFAVLCRLDVIFVPVAWLMKRLGGLNLFGVSLPIDSLTGFFEPALYSDVPGNDIVIAQ